MVYQTKKFDVKLKEPDIDKHISPTPSYNDFKDNYESFSNLTNKSLSYLIFGTYTNIKF